MQEHAEIIRLEPQLTVASRNHAQLADVWISISNCTRLTTWAETVRSLEYHDAARIGALAVELVHMSDQRGWIVARGVDLRDRSPSDIEARVRDLSLRVKDSRQSAEVNEPPSVFKIGWSGRLLSSLKVAGTEALSAARPRAELKATVRG